MKKFHQLSKEEQHDILSESREALRLPELLLEKDYWVCRVLEILFEDADLAPHLCFRGGTSLSKAFACIQRFSEDIDIALSPAAFPEISKCDLPMFGDSPAQCDRKNRKLRKYYREIMQNKVMPLLERVFLLRGIKGVRFELEDLDKARDPFVLYVHYPSVLNHQSGSYINPMVKLELSGRAESEPSTAAVVDSYLSKVFPELTEAVSLRAVSPSRTLWEKAFILHEENTRGLPSKPRLARHYYDLDALIRQGHFDASLFDSVRQLRALNYRRAWVNYDTLTLDKMCILPPDEKCYRAWERDYQEMRVMFFGEVEDFSSIIERIRQFFSQLQV